jgi:hypothetical protein
MKVHTLQRIATMNLAMIVLAVYVFGTSARLAAPLDGSDEVPNVFEDG